MGFDTFTNMAKQLSGNEAAKKDQQQQQTDTSKNQGWADVGAAAQKAFTGYQADKAEGKGPDYAEIGDVATKVLSTYRGDETNQGTGVGEKEETNKTNKTKIHLASGFDIDPLSVNQEAVADSKAADRSQGGELGEGVGDAERDEQKKYGENEEETDETAAVEGLSEEIISGKKTGRVLRSQQAACAGDLVPGSCGHSKDGGVIGARGKKNEALSIGADDDDGTADGTQQDGADPEQRDAVGSYADAGRQFSGRGNDQ